LLGCVGLLINNQKVVAEPPFSVTRNAFGHPSPPTSNRGCRGPRGPGLATPFFALSTLVARAGPSNDIVAGKDADDQIRVWVPACATGEEAYSIAILLAAAVPNRRGGAEGPDFCHGHRRARDRNSAGGALPPIAARRRKRGAPPAVVLKEDDHYCPIKSIRETCIFSTHSVIKDPPFSKLDLIACRNLIILSERRPAGEGLSHLPLCLEVERRSVPGHVGKHWAADKPLQRCR
jgi:hypothetical protein